MSSRLIAPYPPSIDDGVSYQGPASLQQNQRSLQESLDDNSPDGEYIEVIRSRPILDGSTRYLRKNRVPNFSSSFNATRTVRKASLEPSRLPDLKDPETVILRSSLQRIRDPVEATGSSTLLRHKQTIIAICILAATWRLTILMDYLAQLVRYYWQT
ncbi:hypothetical protein HG537_0G04690 [Torulaspora globosa]|uniref:Uncharacterized protein n=1 Tax=Torulaspora globosa TaxID=48254 RepID=A0A7H9HWV7_9SACH|nr:hypothetical protein HG537_0G04690 [Torulaspora sp. CBS 2947]